MTNTEIITRTAIAEGLFTEAEATAIKIGRAHV